VSPEQLQGYLVKAFPFITSVEAEAAASPYARVSGPFRTRSSAERFAAVLVGSGRFANIIIEAKK
jgi:hypothetical protein